MNQPKMTKSFNYVHVVPNLHDLLSSDEHWGPNYIGPYSLYGQEKKKNLCSTEESIKIVNHFF